MKSGDRCLLTACVRYLHIFRNILAGMWLVLAIVAIACCSYKKDMSYTVTEYRKMGMPDPSVSWSKDEYAQALSVLRNLKLYGSLTMPKKFSNKSGIIFKRLLSQENMAFVDDTTLLARDKAFRIQHFSSFQAGMIGLYTYKVKDLRYYRDELVDLYIFGLLVHNNMLDLSEELNQSDNGTDKVLTAGSSFVIKEYSDLIMKILKEQLNSKIYRNKGLKRLSKSLTESLIQNWERLGSADKQKIIVEIRNVISKSSSKFIRTNYQQFLDVLQGSIPKE